MPPRKTRKNLRPAVAPFRFLDLPYDARLIIYGMVLPTQDPKTQGEYWLSQFLPVGFLGLFRANKQISSETRRIYYGGNSFTIKITRQQASFLGIDRCSWTFEHFPSTPSMRYLKHLQLDLDIDPWYGRSGWYREPERDTSSCKVLGPHLISKFAKDQHYHRDALLGVCVKLAREANDLQTLKIRVPCLCYTDRAFPDTARKSLLFSLAPLQQLQFKASVKVIAWPCRNPFMESDEQLPMDPLTQCLQASCLALAKSFTSFTKALQSPQVPKPLTSRQSKWLKLKEAAGELRPGFVDQRRLVLYIIWTAMETHSEEAFDQKARMAIEWTHREYEHRREGGRAQKKRFPSQELGVSQDEAWQEYGYR
ncbi:MAG: hypothetical protein Q9181_001442 [Wetmoreana brouardii]